MIPAFENADLPYDDTGQGVVPVPRRFVLAELHVGDEVCAHPGPTLGPFCHLVAVSGNYSGGALPRGVGSGAQFISMSRVLGFRPQGLSCLPAIRVVKLFLISVTEFIHLPNGDNANLLQPP